MEISRVLVGRDLFEGEFGLYMVSYLYKLLYLGRWDNWNCRFIKYNDFMWYWGVEVGILVMRMDI